MKIIVLLMIFFGFSGLKADDIKTIHKLSLVENDLLPGDWFFIDIGNTLISKGKVAESGVDAMVKRLQEKGVIVIGVTANTFKKRDQYTEILKETGFVFNIHAGDLKLHSIYPKRFSDETGTRGFYRGCIYAHHAHGTPNNKGAAIETFYNVIKRRLKEQPKRIAFVDDVLGNVQSVKSRFPDIPKLLYFYVNVRAALEGAPVNVTDPNDPNNIQVFLKVPQPLKRKPKPKAPDQLATADVEKVDSVEKKATETL